MLNITVRAWGPTARAPRPDAEVRTFGTPLTAARWVILNCWVPGDPFTMQGTETGGSIDIREFRSLLQMQRMAEAECDYCADAQPATRIGRTGDLMCDACAIGEATRPIPHGLRPTPVVARTYA